MSALDGAIDAPAWLIAAVGGVIVLLALIYFARRTGG